MVAKVFPAAKLHRQLLLSEDLKKVTDFIWFKLAIMINVYPSCEHKVLV
jgi:hypothetical protein